MSRFMMLVLLTATTALAQDGATLTNDQHDAVINYLGLPDKAAVVIPPTAFCKVQNPLGKSNQAEWQGWGGDASNSRFANTATAGRTLVGPLRHGFLPHHEAPRDTIARATTPPKRSPSNP